MTYRRSGASGLDLPAISLGLHRTFAADRPPDVRRAVLLRAFDRGVTHLDTANVYGPPIGHAEEFLGHLLKTDLKPHRDELTIATKAGIPLWQGRPYGEGGSRKHLLASLDASLKRLGLDYVDIFYHHRADETVPLEETAAALAQTVRCGKALYIGVSNYPAARTARLADLLKQERVPLTIAQERYNLLDRRMDQPRDGSASVIDTLVQVGAGFAVHSPLDQGRLTGRYLAGVPEGSRATIDPDVRGRLTDEYIEVAKQLTAYANDCGQRLEQMAVAWLLRHQAVTTVLVGASSVAQLDASLDTLGQPEAAAEAFQAIETLIAAHPDILTFR
jgi:L-glyceraldehyde 3-phosphate reductase